MRFNDELLRGNGGSMAADGGPGNDDGGFEEPRWNGERDLEELLIDPWEDGLTRCFCDESCVKTEMYNKDCRNKTIKITTYDWAFRYHRGRQARRQATTCRRLNS